MVRLTKCQRKKVCAILVNFSKGLLTSWKNDVLSGECPCCHAQKTLHFFARYQRWLIFWISGKQQAEEVTVDRYICSNCCSTHALMFPGLVPYRRYSLQFILLVLQYYMLHQENLRETAMRFGVGRATIRNWLAVIVPQLHIALCKATAQCRKELKFLVGNMDEQWLSSFLVNLSRMPAEHLRSP